MFMSTRFIPKPVYNGAEGGAGSSGTGGAGSNRGSVGERGSIGGFGGSGGIGAGGTAVDGGVGPGGSASANGSGGTGNWGGAPSGRAPAATPQRAPSVTPQRAPVQVTPQVSFRAPVVAPAPAPAPVATPAAPVTAQNAAVYGPNAMNSAPMSASQVAAISAANQASASPNTSMGPMSQRGTVSSSGYGAPSRGTSVSATPSASTGSPGGFSGGRAAATGMGSAPSGISGVGSPGGISGGRANSGGLGGIGNASNVGFGGVGVGMAGRGDFGGGGASVASGGVSGGAANAGSLGGIGNAANVGLGGTNVAGKSDMGGYAGQSSNVAGKSDMGVPGINSNADMAALAAAQRGLALSSVANKSSAAPAPVSSTPMGLSNLTQAQIDNTIANIVGLPGATFPGLSPVGSFATNPPTKEAIARAEGQFGLPASGSYSQPSMSATPTTGTKAIQDRLGSPLDASRAVQEAVKGLDLGRPSYGGVTPPDGGPAFGTMVDDKGYNFYDSANSYMGVEFPDVNSAYPASQARGLPGGYSQTPAGGWAQTAQSFDNPMDAVSNMGFMDQMRAAAMFAGLGKANEGGNRAGGSAGEKGKEAKGSTREKVAEKLRRASQWVPYSGPTRFANWSPIQKALLG